MIFSQYTYKVKFKALLLVGLLLVGAAYKRSFANLFILIRENKELTEKQYKLHNYGSDVASLQQQLDKIDRVIGKDFTDKEQIQQDIVNFTVTKKNDVSIHSMKSIHEFADENYNIYTNQMDVTGDVNNLLQLSYEFEKSFNNSRLASLKFYTIKKDNIPTVLHLKMIFQNYESTK